MVTLQIPLQEKTIHAFKGLANQHGMTVERFLSERLNQIVAEAHIGNIDTAFRKIVQDSIEANRELLKKLAE
ncbi:MAG: hypothetical protein ACREOI_06315 [bacterium]